MTPIELQGQAAKAAARVLAVTGTAAKNAALAEIAKSLRENTDKILAANALDMGAARESGMRESLLDRLELTAARIAAIADGVEEIITLPDPIGKVENMSTRPNGLLIGRKKVPLGVIAFIYEARPNVTVDAAALCLKSGNAVILRGGKEAFNSNLAFTELMRAALSSAGLPENAVSLITDTTRESVGELMNLVSYVDLLIPRGGAGLINHVVTNAKVPVIQTGVGNCHIYVEKTADLEMGAEIIFNAKTSRPSVCNAAETLLVDRDIAAKFLPLAKAKLDTKNTELRGCAETLKILPDATPATEEDFYAEFLDYILAVKVVGGLDEALAHIAKYGSGHSEAIVTNDYAASQRFLEDVDAAAVYVNASTRFTDGGVFGLGAELGISTQKLHARGPMGLEQLTSSKYIIYGSGQVR
ncbi:MAG: glutamate-5-semialdehyde dehydrogenase [Oscillospiraceae bacterium]|jgi:glutamate-5-semialdehyde dehydrogenase|nr:glutamate-5-semialdehyde dehydrogenase [Oscillospiraceae bacterium]